MNNMQIKDNKITELLRVLSTLEDVVVVLKGGTSLTKGYGIGERMSEDADVVYFIDGEVSKKTALKLRREVRNLIKNNFNVINEKPTGGGSVHYSADIEVMEGFRDNIKLDLRYSNSIIPNTIVDINEFNKDGILEETDVKFRVANLIDTFYDKIFSFQNRAYTEIVKNGRRKKMTDEERKLNELPTFRIKRLARHAYDITRIFSDDFISKEIIEQKMQDEKNSYFVSITGKNFLKKTYDKKLSSFIIFNSGEIIKQWLKTIQGDFIVSVNPDEIIESLEEIKRKINKIY